MVAIEQRRSFEAPIAQVIALCVVFAALVSPASAQTDLPPIPEYPEPTIVLKLERVPNCKGCSAFEYLLYSDSTIRYVGKEAVFLLGEEGDFREVQRRRTSQPRRGAYDHAYIMNDRHRYKNRLTLAADPKFFFRQRLAEVERSPFFSVQQPELVFERETPDILAIPNTEYFEILPGVLS